MKRLLTILFIVSLMASIGALVPGCGHGRDAEPYEIYIDDGDDTEYSPQALSANEHAAVAVDGMAKTLFEVSVILTRAVGFVSIIPTIGTYDVIHSTTINEQDILNSHRVLIEGFGVNGTKLSMRAIGDAVALRSREGHCAIFATLAIDYDDYAVHSEVTINGSGQARIMLTSFGCRFSRYTHADVTISGDFFADDQSFNDLLFEADYENSSGTVMNIDSAVVRGDDFLGYCMTSEQQPVTVCYSWDRREPVNYCNAEEHSCEVTEDGHDYCREILNSSDAYCNIGCCVESTNGQNTCNANPSAQRDCNPTEDTFFTDTYLMWGEYLHTYELPIKCSEDGLWAPPCPLDGSYDVCPYGGTCVPTDDKTFWGYGFEDYGHCVCTEPIVE